VTTAPAWSFDGSSIAFARQAESGAGRVEVWSYRLDSGRLEPIGPFTPTSLEWSSDGSTIYATGVASEGASPSPAATASPAIRRAPANALGGANPGFTALDGSGPSDREPATCSFDRRLAFIRDARGQPQLWLMNGNGTGVEQITFASSSLSSASMTPSGCRRPSALEGH
jgi:Tol biopolymer transport system component